MSALEVVLRLLGDVLSDRKLSGKHYTLGPSVKRKAPPLNVQGDNVELIC